MKKHMIKGVLLFLILMSSISTYAFPPPPPVDIPIQNIPQQTEVWCWAAVAQQIIHFKNGPMNTPAQCAMVALSKNAPIPYCCSNFNNCATTGSLTEIQALLSYFGGSFSSYSPPADPMSLYYTLAQNKPVIMQISTVPPGFPSGMNHVIVIRGMFFQTTPMGVIPILIVNDPMNQYTQPVPYAQLAPLWQSAIVVHN